MFYFDILSHQHLNPIPQDNHVPWRTTTTTRQQRNIRSPAVEHDVNTPPHPTPPHPPCIYPDVPPQQHVSNVTSGLPQLNMTLIHPPPPHPPCIYPDVPPQQHVSNVTSGLPELKMTLIHPPHPTPPHPPNIYWKHGTYSRTQDPFRGTLGLEPIYIYDYIYIYIYMLLLYMNRWTSVSSTIYICKYAENGSQFICYSALFCLPLKCVYRCLFSMCLCLVLHIRSCSTMICLGTTNCWVDVVNKLDCWVSKLPY